MLFACETVGSPDAGSLFFVLLCVARGDGKRYVPTWCYSSGWDGWGGIGLLTVYSRGMDRGFPALPVLPGEAKYTQTRVGCVPHAGYVEDIVAPRLDWLNKFRTPCPPRS